MTDVKQQHEDVLAKAAAVEETVKSEGWKIIMDLFSKLQHDEIRAVLGHKLNHDHYRKIGMLQAMEFIKAEPYSWKERKAIKFLLHQGRAQAFEVFKRLPQYFFEGKAASRSQMDRIYGSKGGESPEQFHERVFKQEG